MSMVSRITTWVRRRPHTVASLILGLGVIASLGVDRQQDIEVEQRRAEARIDQAARDARDSCVSENVTNERIRRIGVNLAVTSAESIISVADSPDPAIVEAYRASVLANAQQTVSVLEDRDCEAVAAEARRDATRTEGLAMGGTP